MKEVLDEKKTSAFFVVLGVFISIFKPISVSALEDENNDINNVTETNLMESEEKKSGEEDLTNGEASTKENQQTGDNIFIYVITLIIGITSLIACGLYLKNNN